MFWTSETRMYKCHVNRNKWSVVYDHGKENRLFLFYWKQFLCFIKILFEQVKQWLFPNIKCASAIQANTNDVLFIIMVKKVFNSCFIENNFCVCYNKKFLQEFYRTKQKICYHLTIRNIWCVVYNHGKENRLFMFYWKQFLCLL